MGTIRKTVTVLFCDLVDSTALGEALDPERLRSVLGRWYEAMREPIERHGGTVEKFIGDAVMAVFGVPAVHEDDAVRAVRAAVEMRDALPELGVDGRIGIATGEVVTGTEERLATGDAVNVAARLQQGAAPGEIVVDAATQGLTRDAVTVEALEPLELKGKQARVAAFRLVSLERDAPGVARHLDVPMVGRARERKLLEDAFDSVAGRRSCALFTLLGAAGVGKSRLAREFLAYVDAQVLVGRCLSYGDGISYWPVVEVVKQLVRSPQEGPIAALLGESDAPTTPEEIAWAVRKLLEAAARERPLVVVFDDIHWGEPTFLDLVEHVADLSRDAPILLLCLARPELLDRRPGWGGGKLNATTVLLEPLDAVDTDALIELLLGGETLERGLPARIRAAAEGNPLFVEEMLAMVRASGERDVVVPPTIKALLAARLDQLEPAERGVLERGAVEGQLFHSAAVEALADGPVEGQLVQLVRKELVRPDRPQLPASDAYRFRHLLIRDAAYDALPKAVRAVLHEKFAGWLEEHGRELVERDEIVGYHLEQAYRYGVELGVREEELAARACDRLALAAQGALVRGDVRAALTLLQRAIALETPDALVLAPRLGELLLHAGEIGAATALLTECAERARDAGDELTAAVAAVWAAAAMTYTSTQTLTMEETIVRADEAAALLDRAGDHARAAGMRFVSGRHRFFCGRAREGEHVLAQAARDAIRVGDLPRARECLLWELAAKTFGAAPVDEVAEVLAWSPPAVRPALENAPLYQINRAWVDGARGRFDEARTFAAEQRALMRELGMAVHAAGAAILVGDIEIAAGDYEAAARVFREGYDALGALKESGFRATLGTQLADALVRLGRDDEAEDVLDDVDTFVQVDDVDPQVRRRSVRAQLLARRGEVAEAVRLAREAVAQAATTDYLLLRSDALVALAAVLRAAGDDAEAAAALRQALDLQSQKGNLPGIDRVRALLAAAAAPA